MVVEVRWAALGRASGWGIASVVLSRKPAVFVPSPRPAQFVDVPVDSLVMLFPGKGRVVMVHVPRGP